MNLPGWLSFPSALPDEFENASYCVYNTVSGSLQVMNWGCLTVLHCHHNTGSPWPNGRCRHSELNHRRWNGTVDALRVLIRPQHGCVLCHAEYCTDLDSLQLMEMWHGDLAVIDRHMCITRGALDGKVIEKQSMPWQDGKSSAQFYKEIIYIDASFKVKIPGIIYFFSNTEQIWNVSWNYSIK